MPRCFSSTPRKQRRISIFVALSMYFASGCPSDETPETSEDAPETSKSSPQTVSLPPDVVNHNCWWNVGIEWKIIVIGETFELGGEMQDEFTKAKELGRSSRAKMCDLGREAELTTPDGVPRYETLLPPEFLAFLESAVNLEVNVRSNFDYNASSFEELLRLAMRGRRKAERECLQSPGQKTLHLDFQRGITMASYGEGFLEPMFNNAEFGSLADQDNLGCSKANTSEAKGFGPLKNNTKVEQAMRCLELLAEAEPCGKNPLVSQGKKDESGTSPKKEPCSDEREEASEALELLDVADAELAEAAVGVAEASASLRAMTNLKVDQSGLIQLPVAKKMSWTKDSAGKHSVGFGAQRGAKKGSSFNYTYQGPNGTEGVVLSVSLIPASQKGKLVAAEKENLQAAQKRLEKAKKASDKKSKAASKKAQKLGDCIMREAITSPESPEPTQEGGGAAGLCPSMPILDGRTNFYTSDGPLTGEGFLENCQCNELFSQAQPSAPGGAELPPELGNSQCKSELEIAADCMSAYLDPERSPGAECQPYLTPDTADSFNPKDPCLVSDCPASQIHLVASSDKGVTCGCFTTGPTEVGAFANSCCAKSDCGPGSVCTSDGANSPSCSCQPLNRCEQDPPPADCGPKSPFKPGRILKLPTGPLGPATPLLPTSPVVPPQ